VIRLRQAVIAAGDLDEVARRLRVQFGLGEAYSDPAVAYFGLRNAVFALGDTFLEVVSPVREDTSAGRLIGRRGGDCGYMLMLQVDDLTAARARARSAGVGEVFEVSLDDMEEVHLHPRDLGGPIVSLSEPRPPSSWRWGGAGWAQRSAAVSLAGATVAGVGERWQPAIGSVPGLRLVDAGQPRGLIEIELRGPGPACAVQVGSVTVRRVGDD